MLATATTPTVLLMTADAGLAETLQSELQSALDVLRCPEPAELMPMLAEAPPWMLIADFRRPSQGGHIEARSLDLLAERHKDLAVLVLLPVSGPEPLERSVACSPAASLREPIEPATLSQLLLSRVPKKAVAPVAPAANPEHRSVASEMDGEFVLPGMTRRFETNTAKMKMVLQDLEVAARHDVTVLLIGETGAGKTFLSKLIHEISPRRNEPFLTVACGALPNDLIESELFGHVKGSFTGAHADKEGKFIAARRGTILLDEIDVLGLEQQVKLLRVIESGEFEPVGSNTTYRCEARLIVASNLDLQPLVEQGKFRPDLYYRLNMLKFDVLPLRARKPDIIPIAKKFIREQCVKHGVRIDRIDEDLYAALLRYPWPGNVRELEHVIQRAVIYCRDGQLAAQHLPTHVLMCQAGPGNEGRAVTNDYDVAGPSTLAQQRALTEREVIEQTLFQNNYSRTHTARALGISRVTLYNKMKKYGMTK